MYSGMRNMPGATEKIVLVAARGAGALDAIATRERTWADRRGGICYFEWPTFPLSTNY